VSIPSSYEGNIKLDVPRTLSSHQFFSQHSEGQVKLFNVLKAFSNYHQEVGYCQGINFVTAILLLQLPEEESFWVLVQIFKNYKLEELFMPEMPGMKWYLCKLDSLIREILPDFAKSFNSPSNTFAYKWFLTLFACRCKVEVTTTIFDWFLADGWNAIFFNVINLCKKMSRGKCYSISR